MVTWEASFFHPPPCCWLPISLSCAEDPREIISATLHRKHKQIKEGKTKLTTKKQETGAQPPVISYWYIIYI